MFKLGFIEDPFRVIVAEFEAELVSALRNRANPAPFAITNLENAIY